MTQLFNGDSMLQLKLDTGITLTGATAMKILWKDPEGTSGEWIVVSTDGTKLVYNVLVTDITIVGKWSMQAYVELGGLVGYGQVVTQNFISPLYTIAL